MALSPLPYCFVVVLSVRVNLVELMELKFMVHELQPVHFLCCLLLYYLFDIFFCYVAFKIYNVCVTWAPIGIQCTIKHIEIQVYSIFILQHNNGKNEQKRKHFLHIFLHSNRGRTQLIKFMWCYELKVTYFFALTAEWTFYFIRIVGAHSTLE